MIRSRWSKWLSGVGGALLVGGLVLANYGGGVTPAEAHHDYRHGYQNPFKQIMSKLNLILDKLNAGGGGAPLPSTGGAAENYTMRWDTNKPSAERFTVLADFGGAAVRDNNTGLVWEKSPSTIPLVTGTVPVTTTWIDARTQCLEKNVGGTRGWRLPSVVELATLIDPLLGKPFLPVNVFTGVQSATYWSATTNAAVNPGASSTKFLLSFDDGTVGTVSPLAQGNTANFWCVRGPMSESAY
jgi:hypothetical protein